MTDETKDTATGIALKEHEENMKQRALNKAIEAFARNWAPSELNDVHRFHAELHMLVREIHRDAQLPVAATIENILKSVPYSPVSPVWLARQEKDTGTG